MCGGGQRWGQSQRGNSPHGPGQGHATSCIPTDGLSGEILSIPEAFLCGAHPQQGPSRSERADARTFCYLKCQVHKSSRYLIWPSPSHPHTRKATQGFAAPL